MALSYPDPTRLGRRGVATRVADLIWPPRSLLTEQIVERPGVIEPEAWLQLNFLSDPQCHRCGFPLTQDVGEGALCGPCTAELPPFDRARAALAYDDLSAKLVLDLKRGGRRDGLSTFAAWMANAAADLLAESDLIAPAPMHWTRLAQRNFNQAAWLAQALSKATGVEWRPSALERFKRRRSQEGLSASARQRNVAGAIRTRGRFEGQTVLVVDDVYTTGATAGACARALRKAGAAKVHIATLARVVRPIDVLI